MHTIYLFISKTDVSFCFFSSANVHVLISRDIEMIQSADVVTETD